MDTLKRILAVMVVILVVLLAAGGYYAAKMGNMQHGASTAQSSSQTQKDSGQDNMAAMNDNQSMQMSPEANGINKETQNGSVSNTDQQASKDQQSAGAGQNEQSKGNNQGNAPVIVQVPAQTPQTDPRIYVEQIKERLKAIDEANSSIAANSGGHTSVVQSNGSVDSTGQDNMNNLHQEFYKLGQNVESMQESLSKLSTEINNNQSYATQNVPPNYYQYPYNPYQTFQGQNNPGQMNPQQNQQGQNQNSPQTNQDSGNMNNMSGMSNMGSSQTNHNMSITGMLNADTLKLVFSLVLIGSIILAIVAIVGFIGSLFKKREAPQADYNNQSVM